MQWCANDNDSGQQSDIKGKRGDTPGRQKGGAGGSVVICAATTAAPLLTPAGRFAAVAPAHAPSPDIDVDFFEARTPVCIRRHPGNCPACPAVPSRSFLAVAIVVASIDLKDLPEAVAHDWLDNAAKQGMVRQQRRGWRCRIGVRPPLPSPCHQNGRSVMRVATPFDQQWRQTTVTVLVPPPPVPCHTTPQQHVDCHFPFKA